VDLEILFNGGSFFYASSWYRWTALFSLEPWIFRIPFNLYEDEVFPCGFCRENTGTDKKGSLDSQREIFGSTQAKRSLDPFE